MVRFYPRFCDTFRNEYFPKNLIIDFVFTLFGLTAQAQDKKKELSATIGFVLNHEDLGSQYQVYSSGIYLGFNLYAKNMKRTKSDIQLSINVSERRGGNSAGRLLSVNTLYGARYYFTGQDKSTVVFANALIGGVLFSETGDDFTENLIGFGYAAGCYVDTNRFIIGVSAESYNNFILKLGYTF